MFALYSKSCEYAIWALIEIVRLGTDQKCKASDVCRKAGVPEAYARKTFQMLVQNDFLKATPGPGGGYILNRDPMKITVMDVINAVEGEKHFSSCVLGFASCNHDRPCHLHHDWLNVKTPLLESLSSRTLAEFVNDSPKKKQKNKI